MDDLRRILNDPARKQSFVTPMFDRIAPRYDEFTRRFSFGMDADWKRTLLDWYQRYSAGARRTVDVACGTGDLAFQCADLSSLGGEVIGVDASLEMVRAACQRGTAAARPVSFVQGDLCRTALPDGWADAVTAGYAFRNAPSLDASLSEMARILRPGGHLYSLDFYRPANALWRIPWLAYLRATGGVTGWLWHRSPVTYSYIAHSIDAWVSVEHYHDALIRHGFAVVAQRTVLLSGVAMHAAVRR